MAKTGPKGPRIWTEARINEEIEPLLEYAQTAKLPILEEFSTQRDFYISQVRKDFVKRSEKFRMALEKFKAIQKYKWLLASLEGKNTAAFIFALKNITDMRDQQHIKHDGAQINQFFNLAKAKPTDPKNRLNQVNADRS